MYYAILFLFFFFNDTATTEIYTLSLHDALPICTREPTPRRPIGPRTTFSPSCPMSSEHRSWDTMERKSSLDRKSTRLNSSHLVISYAVFCLKKKKSRASYRCNVKH